MSVNELVFVGFLSEMEVRGYGVLEEMNDQVADKNQERGAPAAQFQGGGKNFDDGRSQHESRAQGDKVSEVGAIPVFLDDDGAAEDVSRGGGQAQKKTENDGMHAPEDDISSQLPVGEWASREPALSEVEGCSRAGNPRTSITAGFGPKPI